MTTVSYKIHVHGPAHTAHRFTTYINIFFFANISVISIYIRDHNRTPGYINYKSISPDLIFFKFLNKPLSVHTLTKSWGQPP